ncbi:SpoIIE family protein phosphatase [Streptomyces arenae]|uniref:SpoIIE family protein phosphatase n=1 Tax=Streptomyces arenae TaxID=29301 RepID=UPI00265998FC|nr:SpoIIE family protein phosphatase [Streptomyces arenae]MCG7208102.1 SpoIIE family protein phosphatase [Streptomyces arenae]
MDTSSAAEAAALAKVVSRQRAELDRLRDSLATSAVVERAKGALMATTGCTPDAAHEALVRRAEGGNRTLLEECWLTLGALTPSAPPVPDPGAEPPAPAGERTALAVPEIAEILGRLGKALVRVTTPRELAGTLLEHLAPRLGADAVLLYRRLPDNGLELVADAGVDAALADQWRLVPPLSGIAPLEAIKAGEPLWLEHYAEDRRRYQLIGEPHGRWRSRAWLPMTAGGGTEAALGVLRPDRSAFQPADRELLTAVARLCAGRLSTLGVPASPVPSGFSRAVQSVLDALPGAVVLLTPLRSPGGTVEDYRIDAATPDAMDILGRTGQEMIGAHILESYPSVAGESLWQGYLKALGGEPYEGEPFVYEEIVAGVPLTATYSVRAARLGDGLLVSWLRHDTEERQEQRLADMQRLGNLGWANWNLITRQVTWSSQVYTILGRDPGRGAVPLDLLPDLVLPEDAHTLARGVAELARTGRRLDVPFRLRSGNTVRHLRAVAEAVNAPDGTVVEVHGFVQDLTAQRSAELALVDSERAILVQRGVLDAERALATRLQHALLPLPSEPVRLCGLRVEVAYLPAQAGIHVGGDWFSAVELPGDAALFVVGDVAGHGVDAVATMAQLRFTAKGMVSTGSSLTGALARLNFLLLHSRDSQSTATLILARYEPAGRRLVWAQAGHLPPLLVRDGEVRRLDRPDGMLLGAHAEPSYESAEFRLEPGDRLLMYTDGLVERPGEDIDAGLTRLAEAVRTAGPDSLAALLDAMLVGERRDDVCVLDIRVPLEGEE